MHHDKNPLTISANTSRHHTVPLARGRQGHALIDKEDHLRLIEAGYGGSWFLNDPGSGKKYVCLGHGGTNKKVARLIMDPPRGYVVRYRNNDRKDLRRSNLVLQSRKSLKAENLGEDNV